MNHVMPDYAKLSARILATGLAVIIASGLSTPSRAVVDSANRYQLLKLNPHQVFDVICNIKIAFEGNRLTDESFYRDKNLLDFSGGTELIWVQNNPTGRSAHISGFEHILAPIRAGVPGMNYLVARWTEKDGRRRASIAIHVLQPAVMFEDIVTIFGNSYVDYPEQLPSPHRILKAPTHPHGNERVKYTFEGAGNSYSAVLEFTADGSLQDARVEDAR